MPFLGVKTQAKEKDWVLEKNLGLPDMEEPQDGLGARMREKPTFTQITTNTLLKRWNLSLKPYHGQDFLSNLDLGNLSQGGAKTN